MIKNWLLNSRMFEVNFTGLFLFFFFEQARKVINVLIGEGGKELLVGMKNVGAGGVTSLVVVCFGDSQSSFTIDRGSENSPLGRICAHKILYGTVRRRIFDASFNEFSLQSILCMLG